MGQVDADADRDPEAAAGPRAGLDQDARRLVAMDMRSLAT